MTDPAFTLLCTGGRDYPNRARVFEVLDAVHRKHSNLTILHGACPTGADLYAQEWAVERQRPFIGDPRGPQVLLAYLPHAAVAFEGASDMVRQARAAGLKPWMIDWEEGA